MAHGVFVFRGFSLIPATESDFALAREWTEADPEHRGKVNPRFWLEQGQGMESYLLRDSLGPLLFFKMVRRNFGAKAGVELHIQFPPVAAWEYSDQENERKQREGLDPTAPVGRCRLRTGLIQGYEWLERILRSSSVDALFFESENRALIRFCEKRLGFHSEGSALWKWMDSPPPLPLRNL